MTEPLSKAKRNYRRRCATDSGAFYNTERKLQGLRLQLLPHPLDNQPTSGDLHLIAEAMIAHKAGQRVPDAVWDRIRPAIQCLAGIQ